MSSHSFILWKLLSLHTTLDCSARQNVMSCSFHWTENILHTVDVMIVELITLLETGIQKAFLYKTHIKSASSH